MSTPLLQKLICLEASQSHEPNELPQITLKGFVSFGWRYNRPIPSTKLCDNGVKAKVEWSRVMGLSYFC